MLLYSNKKQKKFKKMFKNKKGFMYLIDLFVAAMIITAGLWILFFNLYYSTDYTKQRLLSEDLLKSFYTKKISEVNNDIILNLTNPNSVYFQEHPLLSYEEYGIINPDFTLVQQAVEYYVLYKKAEENNDNIKRAYYELVLNDYLKGTLNGLIPQQYNYQVIINSDKKIELKKNTISKEKASLVLPSKTIVAGIDREEEFFGPILFEVYLWQ